MYSLKESTLGSEWQISQRDSAEPQAPASPLINLCFTVGAPEYETYRGVMGMAALRKSKIATRQAELPETDNNIWVVEFISKWMKMNKRTVHEIRMTFPHSQNKGDAVSGSDKHIYHFRAKTFFLQFFFFSLSIMQNIT